MVTLVMTKEARKILVVSFVGQTQRSGVEIKSKYSLWKTVNNSDCVGMVVSRQGRSWVQSQFSSLVFSLTCHSSSSSLTTSKGILQSRDKYNINYHKTGFFEATN